MSNRNEIVCSDLVPPKEVGCDIGGSARGKQLAATQYGTIGDHKVVQHTIYNHRHKTSKQVEDILMHQQELFLAVNPDYQYNGYKTQDGKHGERIVFLMFKKKMDAS